MEKSVLLFDKKYKCSMRRESRLGKSYIKVPVDEFLKGLLFSRRQTVDNAQLAVDLKVVRAMESEIFGLYFAKYIYKFIILRWNGR